MSYVRKGQKHIPEFIRKSADVHIRENDLLWPPSGEPETATKGRMNFAVRMCELRSNPFI